MNRNERALMQGFMDEIQKEAGFKTDAAVSALPFGAMAQGAVSGIKKKPSKYKASATGGALLGAAYGALKTPGGFKRKLVGSAAAGLLSGAGSVANHAIGRGVGKILS